MPTLDTGRPIHTLGAAAMLAVALGLSSLPGQALAGETGPAARNKALARTAFDLLNHRDFPRFEALHTRDFVKHYNGSAAEDLAQEMVDAKGQFVAASDLAFKVEWMLSEGDRVAVCFTSRGTHDGPFQGVPATGKPFRSTAMTVWRFVDGRIAEEWVFSNDLELYQQLGLLGASAATP
jgi:steroid delta-isomerase-like uncharacterized protein